MIDNKTFYQNIRIKCAELGITIAQLERELGFAKGSIGKWMNSFPLLDRAIKVADYLDISIDELCSRNRQIALANNNSTALNINGSNNFFADTRADLLEIKELLKELKKEK